MTYLGLAAKALGHNVSAGAGGEAWDERGLAHWIISQPVGSYLAIAVGLGFAAGGAVTAAKGVQRKFEKYLRLPQG
ncbi:hypothetical protein NDL68_13095 [Neorhizobium galegae]|nr:hypothetical protein [Neorhizobium galegae]MCM2498781.1 hypothetical protein [Neorhizobium galegae]